MSSLRCVRYGTCLLDIIGLEIELRINVTTGRGANGPDVNYEISPRDLSD